MAKFYLHSAIPYVNAAPHIGHAQEFVLSDVARRYHTLLNDDTLYLCGADENGLKIIQAAEKAGVDPNTFCDTHQREFLDLGKKLNVRFDVWQRGTNKNHFASSQKLWELCAKNGDIYKKSYEGLYCVGCEAFYTPDELDANGECIEHPGKKLEEVAEENYFFRLSKYQTFLKDLIKGDTLAVTPEIRKNEALAFIDRGLEDFSVSRSRKRAKNWGVPVPGDPNQIMYVWFDALNIYYSGIGFGWDDATFHKWAPADLMVIGKGILRFHAVYWPAILKSAGLPLPKRLFVHGYLTVDGQKMSKTVGNVVDPTTLIEKYRTDPLRYYLLREIPSYADGDFSERRFKELYNADLANGLGNLVARIAKLCETIPQNYSVKSLHTIFDKDKYLGVNIAFSDYEKKYVDAVNRFAFHEALTALWKEIKALDAAIDQIKPWEHGKKPERKEEIEEFLISKTERLSAVVRLINIAIYLQPFLPDTAEKILKQFEGPTITSQPALFPRL